MSRSQSSGAPGGGVMRFLAGGAGSARFAGIFQFADAIFAPSKQAAWAEREQQRRRRVAVPAPGEPPEGGGAGDEAVALPTGLLGEIVLDEQSDEPPDE